MRDVAIERRAAAGRDSTSRLTLLGVVSTVVVVGTVHLGFILPGDPRSPGFELGAGDRRVVTASAAASVQAERGPAGDTGGIGRMEPLKPKPALSVITDPAAGIIPTYPLPGSSTHRTVGKHLYVDVGLAHADMRNCSGGAASALPNVQTFDTPVAPDFNF